MRVASAGLWAIALLASLGASGPKADRIFLNGVVWTGDSRMPRAQAVAIRGDRILALGSNQDVRKVAEPKTDTIDLRGHLLLPGFIDAHVHLLEGGLSLSRVRLEGAGTPEEVQRRIEAFALAHPDAPWVLGQGWRYSAFPGGLPPRALLDKAVPDRPAFIRSADSRTAWCNTVALRAAQVGKKTTDPGNGTIVRDAAGEPTGILEDGAQSLVEGLIPLPTEEEKERALKSALELLASQGITSAQDPRFDPDDLPLLDRVARQGGLVVRVYAALPLEVNPSPELLERYRGLRTAHGGSSLRVRAVGTSLDGVVETKTAALLEPYAGGGTGRLALTPEQIAKAVAVYEKEGFQVLLDASGDRAIRAALDAYEEAARKNGPLPRRHRIEGIAVPVLGDLPRLQPLDVVASTVAQAASDGIRYQGDLGPERAGRAMPFRLIDDAGAVQAFGSGWPEHSPDVLKGIHAAITRQGESGEPPAGFHPENRVSVEAALRHFTRDGAYGSFDEGQKGTIQPGALADFVVLSENILDLPESIPRARVLLTVVGGQDTFRARAF
jgi:predicted amidohydrolase YtcJ